MGAAFNKLNARMSDKQAEAGAMNTGMAAPAQPAAAPQATMSPTPAVQVQRMAQMDAEEDEEEEGQMLESVAHKAIQMLAEFVPMLNRN